LETDRPNPVLQRTKCLLLLGPLALFGCTTAQVTAFDQPGVSVSRLSSDLSACSARAEREAPVIVQNQTNFGTTIGVGTGSCGAYYCRGGSGVAFSIDNRRVDVNESRRIGIQYQCMLDKGYTPRQLPACSAEARSGVGFGTSYRQPAVTTQSCATQLQGVGPVIVSP